MPTKASNDGDNNSFKVFNSFETIFQVYCILLFKISCIMSLFVLCNTALYVKFEEIPHSGRDKIISMEGQNLLVKTPDL